MVPIAPIPRSLSLPLLAAILALGLAIPGHGAVARHARAIAAAPAGTPAPAFGPGIGPDGMPTFETNAREAIVVDYNTGATLLEKDADQPMPTASLSKVMTAYVVFQYLREGRAKLTDMLAVSKEAWKTGGSKMFVPYPGSVSIDDLIHGMLIQSGNDACVVLAQGLAGSTAAFVDQMNAEAKKLGLAHSHFADVDGLPDAGHFMSARDLVTLGDHFIRDFPQFYPIVSEKEFTFNGIKQGNRNPLLYKDLGVDGIKTGHTEEAGYGLLVSAKRNGRRITVLVAGLDSVNQRSREGANLLNWAYRSFEDVAVTKAGQAIDEAPVWYGVQPAVPVSTAKDIEITLPRGERRKLKMTAIYDGAIKAPVAKGQVAGKLEIALPNGKTEEVPLIALAAVQRLGPAGRIAEGLAHYLWEKHP